MKARLRVPRTALANGRSRIEERLARWLLMAHDRIDGDQMRLTHEFLSAMLGVRRAGVTEALGALQDAGLVRSHRGVISILDRAGLERDSGFLNREGIPKGTRVRFKMLAGMEASIRWSDRFPMTCVSVLSLRLRVARVAARLRRGLVSQCRRW